jgi:hypothetical protein
MANLGVPSSSAILMASSHEITICCIMYAIPKNATLFYDSGPGRPPHGCCLVTAEGGT